MSEGSGHKIHALSLPLAAGGLSVNPAVLDQSRDPLVPPMMTKQENDDCFTARPITPRWNHCRQVSANHVNFLSARQGLHHAVPAGDIPKGIVLPIGSSESGKQPVVDRCSVNMLKDYESWILTRNLASSKQQLEKKKCTVLQAHHVVTGAMPSFSSNPSCRAVKVTSSRKRRARIAEGLKALEELVPNPTEGGKEAVLDDIIDHIKFLKLQLKALSQSRLGGEAIADPFLYLEGYGHYLLHEQLLGDPLEEIMGEMMETDMAAAIELLNSKGISIIPMALANDLIQSG